MTQTDVLVLFGGQSAEHDVSRVSAAHVLTAIDRTRYNVTACGISREGVWFHAPVDWSADLAQLPEHGPQVDPFRFIGEATGNGSGVVIPVLHGPRGEDGSVQGLLELCNVAYVGSGVLGSSLSMDKAKSNEVLDAAGIPQAHFRSYRVGEFSTERAADVATALGFPLFVKPANMGSSVGVSKASDHAELLAAADLAFEFDTRIVVEEGIDGIEIEIGVLGNRELRVSVPGAIIPSAAFYDYEDKYNDDSAELLIPADVTEAQRTEMERLAKATFVALRAEGLARVDGFVRHSDGKILINEINTFPGFTPISMFPKMWAASGLPYAQLIDTMIELAFDRHRERTAVAMNTKPSERP